MLKKTDYDFIVIGAGAAGLTAAQYGARSGLSTLVIDLSDAGGQALNIFTLENYPGVFPPIPGRDFIKNMEKQAKRFGAKIIHSKVSSIDKIGQQFMLKTADGDMTAYAILIATGAQHRPLGVDGEKKLLGKGVSYCATCDGAFFRKKTVAVVGGGDVALEDAIFLSRFAEKVYIIHRRDEFRGAKVLQDQLLSNEKIEPIYDTVVDEVVGKMAVEKLILSNKKTGEKSELPVQGVFMAVGIVPNLDGIEGLPDRDEGGYIIAGESCETSIPGVFAAGDVRTKQLRQVITAAADGANAITSVERYFNS